MISRRGLFGAATGILLGCKRDATPSACIDTTGLTNDEITVRKMLAYADAARDQKKNCLACAQYIAGAEGSCGTCKLLKGPIHPHGTCKAFAPKAS